MSKTLAAIMKHWKGAAPTGEGYFELPFDIEQFCRENDAAYTEAIEQCERLSEALRVIVETTGDDKFVAQQAHAAYQKWKGNK